ncbi:MAG TPA: UDP-2,3-diacylglucosamine diphosphatase LpxI [Candidatus Avacidaminococcus intestinavium]|uniref:UDP-2,3-diacylglucosamine diphosphatase LpxI n=1 Tax=Candidatus Avacidaminococcus intestinavium TaxID=2840684 RepID=A0A9D1SLC9_9FIRM|nr:UDP-2,3-diacylglucosamine diphosphatase LpxI [Candidatus Avacidaminococcus intestinavium]
METLGLLSGIGHLPVEVAVGARMIGYNVVAIGVVPGIDEDLAKNVDAYYDIHIGKLGKIINTLKKHKITTVTMIGKVTKEILYSEGAIIPDFRAIKLLSSLPNRKDDTIMNAIVRELEKEGIYTLDQTILIKPLLPEVQVFTKRQPTAEEAEDIKFGFDVAREIGRLDIGQTVVVKDKAVMAVEAIEGTDACIKRGGLLGKRAIVAKTAKPAQDIRFDMPSVGLETIKSMVEAGAAGIAMEAGRTLFVEREKAIALANEHNLFIVAQK